MARERHGFALLDPEGRPHAVYALSAEELEPKRKSLILKYYPDGGLLDA